MGAAVTIGGEWDHILQLGAPLPLGDGAEVVDFNLPLDQLEILKSETSDTVMVQPETADPPTPFEF